MLHFSGNAVKLICTLRSNVCSCSEENLPKNEKCSNDKFKETTGAQKSFKNLIKNHYLSFCSCLSPIYFLIVCQKKKNPCNKMKVSDNSWTPDGEIEQEILLSSVLVTQLNKKHQNIESLFINKN